MTEQTNRRALVAGLHTDVLEDVSLDELKALAEACNIEVVGMYTQTLPTPNTAFYIGRGKVDEIKEGLSLLEAGLVIFDNSLSPIQLRNLADALDCEVKDRTTLILDIFASRARTKEAKLQVELANLQYMLPRLVGLHASLSRQGGTGGSMSNKGAGEKKLELDRRHIEHRISELKKSLELVSKERATTRKQRESSGIKKVALVGYTNAGKSTIMNWMVDCFCLDETMKENKRVLEKDMLFATLDTTIRKITPGKSMPAFLLSDTVGFINKLPHSLVKAFHSTLEEVTYADLILHVVDDSDEENLTHIKVTQDTLQELDATTIPQIVIYNKAEARLGTQNLPKVADGKIYLSAKERIGMDELLSMINDTLYGDRIEATFLLPFERGDILNYLFSHATVLDYSYEENGILCHAMCEKKDFSKFEQYSVRT